ncbi:MAG: hypothetical protein AAGD05_08975, partial [Bacteroidota bacterium]
MKRMYLTLPYVLFFILCCAWSFTLQAQIPQGMVVEGLQCESQILSEAVNYSIYLPPDYDRSRRSYPVVFIFQGYIDKEKGLVEFWVVKPNSEQANSEGRIDPIIKLIT